MQLDPSYTDSKRTLSPDPSESEELQRIAGELFDALARGEQVDPVELHTRYPEHVQELDSLLHAAQLVADLRNSDTASLAVAKVVGDDEVPRRLGDFELGQELGRGGMGVVYQARQISLSRQVALKILPFACVLDPRQLQRFKNEALAAAQLDHPNIVDVYGVGCERGVHFYAMRLIEGRSLGEVLAARRVAVQDPLHLPSGAVASGNASDDLASPPLEKTTGEVETARLDALSTARNTDDYFRQVTRVMIEAAEALHHAHEQGVVHRDVKPSNLLLDDRGKLWVTDFGLAQIESNIDLTMTGELIGTLRYMSPEQASGRRLGVDHRSDIYSLGVTLYELLTSRCPFQSRTRSELLEQILHEDPCSPRRVRNDLPRDLETIVLKAMEKSSTERYETARMMADDLRRYLDDQPIYARRPPLATRALKWGRRHKSVLAWLIVVLFAFGLSLLGMRSYLRGRAAIERLLTAEPRSVSDAADHTAAFRFWTERQLRDLVESEPENLEQERQQLHARLALVRFDKSHDGALFHELLEIEDMAYIPVICEALSADREQVIDQAWKILRERGGNEVHRFRAGLALAEFAPKSKNWQSQDYRLFSEHLVRLNPVFQPMVWPSLRGVRQQLLAPLEAIITDASRTEIELTAAANAIAFFAAEEAEFLSRLILVTSGPQYQILYNKYKLLDTRSERKSLQALVEQQPAVGMSFEDRISLGQKRAAAAITLLRQGRRSEIFDALRYEDDPEAMTQFIHRCRGMGVTPVELLECFDIVDQRRGPLDKNRQKLDDSVMYALLLALGEFGLADLPLPTQPLLDRLVEIYERDPSSGVHGATGWLLRQWGQDAEVERVDQTPIPYDSEGHREWFVREFEYLPKRSEGIFATKRKFHLTFVVFPGPVVTTGSPEDDPQRDPNEFESNYGILFGTWAVCDREISWQQFAGFDGGTHRQAWERRFSRQLTNSHPVFGVNWFEAASYCRWLTELAGMSEQNQWIPAEPLAHDRDPIDGWVALPISTRLWGKHSNGGYQLLGEMSWEYVSRGGTRCAYSFGNDPTWLEKYACYSENHDVWSRPVGELRPNSRGLFDVHGNVSEWCANSSQAFVPGGLAPDDIFFRSIRGGGWSDTAETCRSSNREWLTAANREMHVGLRVAVVPSIQRGLVKRAGELDLLFDSSESDRVAMESLVLRLKKSTSDGADFLQAFRRKKHAAIDALLSAATAADKDEDWVYKTRVATMALCLGEHSLATTMLQGAPDPIQRSEFIATFPSLATVVRHLPEQLHAVVDADFRSGICLALSQLRPVELDDSTRKALTELLVNWYRDAPDSGTHSASGLALRRWGTMLPTVELQSGQPQSGRDWWETPLALTMIRIPAGKFLRPVDDDESQRVDMASDFWLSDREVSIELYERFNSDKSYRGLKPPSPKQPSWHTDWMDDRHPMQMIRWYDAVMFCNWLSWKHGLDECYAIAPSKNPQDPHNYDVELISDGGFRLPTEDEWEYACRGGTTTRFNCGDGEERLRDYAVFWVTRSAPCGSLLCNRWGLFDMHGNVEEWCWDLDPRRPYRVARGGSWGRSAKYCTSAKLDSRPPTLAGGGLGFRVARGLTPSEAVRRAAINIE